MAALVVVVILLISYKKSLRIKGDLYLEKISIVDSSPEREVACTISYDENTPVIAMSRYSRIKQLHRLSGIISAIRRFFEGKEIGSEEYEIYDYLVNNRAGKKLLTGIEKSKIIGSPLGNSFVIKKSPKSRYLTINNRDSGSIRVSDRERLVIAFKEKDATTRATIREIDLEFVFRSTVRVRNNRRGRR